MYIYILHSKLFGSPRTIITDFPVLTVDIEKFANLDNDYSDENKWKVQLIPTYPERNFSLSGL